MHEPTNGYAPTELFDDPEHDPVPHILAGARVGSLAGVTIGVFSAAVYLAAWWRIMTIEDVGTVLTWILGGGVFGLMWGAIVGTAIRTRRHWIATTTGLLMGAIVGVAHSNLLPADWGIGLRWPLGTLLGLPVGVLLAWLPGWLAPAHTYGTRE